MEWNNYCPSLPNPIPWRAKESDKNGRKTRQHNKWGELAISEVELLTDSGIWNIWTEKRERERKVQSGTCIKEDWLGCQGDSSIKSPKSRGDGAGVTPPRWWSGRFQSLSPKRSKIRQPSQMKAPLRELWSPLKEPQQATQRNKKPESNHTRREGRSYLLLHHLILQASIACAKRELPVTKSSQSRVSD